MKIMMLTQIESENERINLNLSDKVVANKANRDEQGNIVEGFHEEEVNNIVMSRKQLCYQLYAADTRIAQLRGLRGKPFTIINLSALLVGAEVEIEVVRHAAGEIDDETGYVHENDSIQHIIKSVKLGERAENALNDALSQAFNLLD